MTEKDLERATDAYIEKMWPDSDPQLVRLAYRAGVAWILRELLNMPWNEVPTAIKQLNDDMRR